MAWKYYSGCNKGTCFLLLLESEYVHWQPGSLPILSRCLELCQLPAFPEDPAFALPGLKSCNRICPDELGNAPQHVVGKTFHEPVVTKRVTIRRNTQPGKLTASQLRDEFNRSSSPPRNFLQITARGPLSLRLQKTPIHLLSPLLPAGLVLCKVR